MNNEHERTFRTVIASLLHHCIIIASFTIINLRFSQKTAVVNFVTNLTMQCLACQNKNTAYCAFIV